MTRTIRHATLGGAMAAAFCLTTLAPTTSNEALAQGIRVTGNAQSYYNGYGAGYNSAYQNGYGINSYGRYATGGNVYTGYGNGPYGYGSSGMFAYPSAGIFGYSNRTTYGLDYRALRYEGGTYRRIYAPDNTRYYNPYGNLRY